MCMKTRRADHRRAGREPRRLGQRLAGVQVDGRDQGVGGSSDRVVLLEHAGQRLALQQPEAVGVLRDLGRRVAPVDVRPVDVRLLGRAVDDEARPVLLDLGDVLDEAAQGQLADRRAGAGLLVRQAVDGDAEQVAVLLERVEEVGALAGEGLRCGRLR